MPSGSVRFTVDAKGMRNLVKRVGEGRKVYEKPFEEPRGTDAVKILRFHPRGLADQFADETEYIGKSAHPWLPTHAFGRTPAPSSTMIRTGSYRSAWLGGPGSKVQKQGNRIAVGVERSIFPQVKIHQSNRQSTLVKPKKRPRGRPSDWSMRFYLGLVHGVWISAKRLSRGLRIQRRRLSVSFDVRRAIARMVGETAKGKIKIGTQRIVRPRT